MKRKILLLLFGLIIGLTAAYFFLRHRRAPAHQPAPTAVVSPPATPVSAPTATPVPATPPPIATAEVPIEDGKTIDFSSGQPKVQNTEEDRAAIEKAKREMDEATQDVTFAPTKPASPPAK